MGVDQPTRIKEMFAIFVLAEAWATVVSQRILTSIDLPVDHKRMFL